MSHPPKVRSNVGKYQCPRDPPCLHQDGKPVRFSNSHQCQPPGHPIDISAGIGLEYLALEDAVAKVSCSKCGGEFVDLSKHVKCPGRKLVTKAASSVSSASASSSSRSNGPTDEEWAWINEHRSNATKHDYSKVLDWQDEFQVDGQSVKGGYAGVADLFLQRKQRVVCLHNKWFPALVVELKKRGGGLRVEDNKGFQILVPCHFSCHDLSFFKITRVQQLSEWNELIYDLTRMNLLTKWTLAQLAYDYWKCPAEVEILQGADYDFAKRGYYGYRKGATLGDWRSDLAEQIENGDLEYEELLNAEQAPNLYTQVDSSSFYSSVMTSQALLPTYYPIGPARKSQEGAKEFARATVGLYEVDFQCPEGLERGILAVRNGNRVNWTLEGAGSGVYTEVDLKHALDYGYTLEFKGPCLLWDAVGHPFDNFVAELFALKESEVNRERRTVLKFLLNALSGKLGQDEAGCYVKKNIEISPDEAYDRAEKGLPYRREGFKFFRSAEAGDEGGASSDRKTKPNHLGAWLMSWTRVQFQQVHDLLEPGECVYEHTDSVRVPLSAYRRLLEAGWIHPTALGLLKIEYGLIYEYEQQTDNYTLKVLKANGELDVIRVGKQREVSN